MNPKLVKELLKQLQQETQDPRDIGNLNIANIIIARKMEKKSFSKSDPFFYKIKNAQIH
jgi:hypothetical protein